MLKSPFAFIISIFLGALLPLMTIVFGDISTVFINFVPYTNYDTIPQSAIDDFNSGISKNCLYFVGIAAISFVASYFLMSMWTIHGERQTDRIRRKYFGALLAQDIGWYDEHLTGELTSKASADTLLIQEGISEKVGFVIQNFTTFIGGFIVGFIKSNLVMPFGSSYLLIVF